MQWDQTPTVRQRNQAGLSHWAPSTVLFHPWEREEEMSESGRVERVVAHRWQAETWHCLLNTWTQTRSRFNGEPIPLAITNWQAAWLEGFGPLPGFCCNHFFLLGFVLASGYAWLYLHFLYLMQVTQQHLRASITPMRPEIYAQKDNSASHQQCC